MARKEESSLPDEKLFTCTLCAKSVKLQELPFKDNSCHVYQMEVSRTIISGFTKTQDYSEVYPIVISHYFGCELDRM